MTLTLYMHPISTVSRPVSLFIAEKNLPVELKTLDLTSRAVPGDQSERSGARARGR
jgi:hypothetical protein